MRLGTNSSSRTNIPFRVSPMLATLVDDPFNREGWVYEEKYDGDRLLAYKEGNRIKLLSRNSKDRTRNFPDIVEAIRRLGPSTLLLDGEMVVFDSSNVSRFQLLQQGKGVPVYAVFDCLYLDGRDLRREPLSSRRAAVEETVPTSKVIFPSKRLSADGLEAFSIAKRRGFEGIVAKDVASPYVEGRSKYWLKVKVKHEDEFVIGGFTEPAGARKYFGALLLGAYRSKKLCYVGKVGTGFDEKTLAQLYTKFRPLFQEQPAFVDPPRERRVHFLDPVLVAQIAYSEWTADQKLRQPVYLGLRDDKRAEEVHFPEAQK
jgi:bifunctional non-homologous end joining protein LigD